MAAPRVLATDEEVPLEDEYEGDADQELLRMRRRAEAAEARVGMLERDLAARVSILQSELLYAETRDPPRPLSDKEMQGMVFTAALFGVVWGLWRYRGYLAFWRPPLWVFRKLWHRVYVLKHM